MPRLGSNSSVRSTTHNGVKVKTFSIARLRSHASSTNKAKQQLSQMESRDDQGEIHIDDDYDEVDDDDGMSVDSASSSTIGLSKFASLSESISDCDLFRSAFSDEKSMMHDFDVFRPTREDSYLSNTSGGGWWWWNNIQTSESLSVAAMDGIMDDEGNVVERDAPEAVKSPDPPFESLLSCDSVESKVEDDEARDTGVEVELDLDDRTMFSADRSLYHCGDETDPVQDDENLAGSLAGDVTLQNNEHNHSAHVGLGFDQQSAGYSNSKAHEIDESVSVRSGVTQQSKAGSSNSKVHEIDESVSVQSRVAQKSAAESSNIKVHDLDQNLAIPSGVTQQSVTESINNNKAGDIDECVSVRSGVTQQSKAELANSKIRDFDQSVSVRSGITQQSGASSKQSLGNKSSIGSQIGQEVQIDSEEESTKWSMNSVNARKSVPSQNKLMASVKKLSTGKKKRKGMFGRLLQNRTRLSAINEDGIAQNSAVNQTVVHDTELTNSGIKGGVEIMGANLLPPPVIETNNIVGGCFTENYTPSYHQTPKSNGKRPSFFTFKRKAKPLLSSQTTNIGSQTKEASDGMYLPQCRSNSDVADTKNDEPIMFLPSAEDKHGSLNNVSVATISRDQCNMSKGCSISTRDPSRSLRTRTVVGNSDFDEVEIHLRPTIDSLEDAILLRKSKSGHHSISQSTPSSVRPNAAFKTIIDNDPTNDAPSSSFRLPNEITTLATGLDILQVEESAEADPVNDEYISSLQDKLDLENMADQNEPHSALAKPQVEESAEANLVNDEHSTSPQDKPDLERVPVQNDLSHIQDNRGLEKVMDQTESNVKDPSKISTSFFNEDSKVLPQSGESMAKNTLVEVEGQMRPTITETTIALEELEMSGKPSQAGLEGDQILSPYTDLSGSEFSFDSAMTPLLTFSEDIRDAKGNGFGLSNFAQHVCHATDMRDNLRAIDNCHHAKMQDNERIKEDFNKSEIVETEKIEPHEKLRNETSATFSGGVEGQDVQTGDGMTIPKCVNEYLPNTNCFESACEAACQFIGQDEFSDILEDSMRAVPESRRGITKKKMRGTKRRTKKDTLLSPIDENKPDTYQVVSKAKVVQDEQAILFTKNTHQNALDVAKPIAPASTLPKVAPVKKKRRIFGLFSRKKKKETRDVLSLIQSDTFMADIINDIRIDDQQTKDLKSAIIRKSNDDLPDGFSELLVEQIAEEAVKICLQDQDKERST